MNLAGSIRSVVEVSSKLFLTSGAIASWKLNPLLFVCLRGELDHLDILRVFLICKNLGELYVRRNRLVILISRNLPLRRGGFLSIHVPVTVWTIGSISNLNMSMFMLEDLMLVFLEPLIGVLENWIINCWWCPVGVICSPSLLIDLFSSWSWRSWHRYGVAWVV